MNTCRLIVCEKSSHWAAALRLSLAGQPPELVELRSLVQVESALVESPASVVGMEISPANINAVLDLLERAGRHFHRARFVAFVASGFADAVLLLREAGAIDVLTTVLDAGRLARLARRHHAAAPASGPLTMRALAAERLPWPAHATFPVNHAHAR